MSKYVSRHSCWVMVIEKLDAPKFVFFCLFVAAMSQPRSIDANFFLLDSTRFCLTGSRTIHLHVLSSSFSSIMSKMPFSLLTSRSKGDHAKQLKDFFTVIENEQDKEKKHYEDVRRDLTHCSRLTSSWISRQLKTFTRRSWPWRTACSVLAMAVVNQRSATCHNYVVESTLKNWW